jgi:sterol desaturase/sphingolipid hydroxylase (fatty acid hydroxylase superfamily)
MYTFEKTLLVAIPGFTVLMLVEYLYGLAKGRNTYANTGDLVSSLSSGLTYVISNTVGFGALIIGYGWLASVLGMQPESAESGALELASVAIGIWVLTFVWVDFTGYWIHRWAHANNFLWAMHMIHHSSEEFNLAVALRQNAFKWFAYNGVMLAPLILFKVPVEVVAIIVPVHLFMQFWYHTRHIGRLGFFEYFLVTPSQHRVHHAINSIYIDKNFGLIFCVWDRLFGTYQKELKEEPCAYGITAAVSNYNPLMIELEYLGRMLRDSFYTRNWKDKFAVFFSRTGWRPADVAERFPVAKIEDCHNFEKYEPKTPLWLQLWGVVQTMITVGLAAYLFQYIEFFSKQELYLYVAIMLPGIYAATNQLQNKGSVIAESIRLGLSLYVV